MSNHTHGKDCHHTFEEKVEAYVEDFEQKHFTSKGLTLMPSERDTLRELFAKALREKLDERERTEKHGKA